MLKRAGLAMPWRKRNTKSRLSRETPPHPDARARMDTQRRNHTVDDGGREQTAAGPGPGSRQIGGRGSFPLAAVPVIGSRVSA